MMTGYILLFSGVYKMCCLPPHPNTVSTVTPPSPCAHGWLLGNRYSVGACGWQKPSVLWCEHVALQTGQYENHFAGSFIAHCLTVSCSLLSYHIKHNIDYGLQNTLHITAIYSEIPFGLTNRLKYILLCLNWKKSAHIWKEKSLKLNSLTKLFKTSLFPQRHYYRCIHSSVCQSKCIVLQRSLDLPFFQFQKTKPGY